MKYFLLSPEVAGGPDTVMSRESHPPIISRLQYEFDVWPGDDLLEGFPCFIVTKRLADAIRHADLSGVEFRHVEITKSEMFTDMYGERALPPFEWLCPSRLPGVDDFAMDGMARLVVSANALQLLRTAKIENCEIEEFDSTSGV